MAATPIKLSDLAQFTIISAESHEINLELRGGFTHLKGVRKGRAWLYQEGDRSISGELTALDETGKTGTLITSNGALGYGVAVGVAFPYLYGIWEPYDIDLVSRNDSWRRVQYQPSEVDGIDHDECRLCHDKLGPRFQPFGFRRSEDLGRPNKQGDGFVNAAPRYRSAS